MPGVDRWLGALGGPEAYPLGSPQAWFDNNPATFGYVLALQNDDWDAGTEVGVRYVRGTWHYGGGGSGAAGPFTIYGSHDSLDPDGWEEVLVVTESPPVTAGVVYPHDGFQVLYDIGSTATYRFWRFRSTDGGSNNDLYTLEGLAPDDEPPPPTPRIVLTINTVEFTRIKELEFRTEESAPGSGHFVLDRNDPDATSENLAHGNIASITIPEIDPDPIFEFLLEDGDFKVVSGDEEGGEEIQFGGPGTLAMLSRAVIAPEEYETGIGAVKTQKGIWKFPDGYTAGHILNKLLREAESGSRPQDPLPGVTDDFTSINDSNGDPWDTDIDGAWKVPIGANLLDEAMRLVRAGLMRIEMAPGGLLHAYTDRGVNRSSSTFAAGKVRFEKGINIASELVRGSAGRQFASHAYVQYSDDDTVHYTNTAKVGTWPYVQEVYIQAPTTHAVTARRYAKGQMGWLEGAQDQPSFEHIVPWPGTGPVDAAGIYLPGQVWTENGRYWLGDIVTLHTGTGDTDYDEATGRVHAITFRMDETGYLAPPIVELNGPYAGGSSDLRSSTVVSGSQGSQTPGNGGSGSGDGGAVNLAPYQTRDEKGDPSGYASLDSGGQVPYPQLGTGGDGSGNNVLHDDQSWSPEATGLVVKDEGTPLATPAATINFVGSGVAATGAGADKTVTVTEPDAAAHLADTTDAHDASAVSIVDTGGYFASTDVEGALQEAGAAMGGGGGGGSGFTEVVVTSNNCIRTAGGGTTTTTYQNDGGVGDGTGAGGSFMAKNLMRFSLTGITTVKVALIKITVTNFNSCLGLNEGVNASLHMARCLRPDYVETEVTWTRYKSGSNWSTAGADNAADRSILNNEFTPPYPNTARMQTSGGATAQEITFDVTAMLRDALVAGAADLCVFLWGNSFGGHNEMIIAAANDATTRYRPRLEWA